MGTSIIDEIPSFQLTTAINAKEAPFNPSRNPPNHVDSRSLGMTLLRAPTNINAGKKIPIEASIAPGIPLIRYPTKVAVVNTGPGVI